MILNIKKKVVAGVFAFSLLTTSWGGAFAVSAYAATPESQTTSDVSNGKDDTKGILTGLLAIGLMSAISSSHGSSDKKSSPNKGTTPTPTPPSNQPPSGSVSGTEEQQALTLLNQDRAKNGLPALKWNSKLASLGESYANDMIKRGFFSHYNPEGLSPFDRMQRAGISYNTAGENLAINTSVPSAEVAFMNSSGHRANILNSSYTDVGIGVVKASNGQVYVVQEFIGK